MQTFLAEVIEDVIDSHTGEGSGDDWDFDALWAELKTLYPISITIEEVLAEAGSQGRVNRDFIKREILSDAKLAYQQREEQLGSPAMRELERRVVLSVIDRRWRDHLYEMDYLKDGIGLRAMAQRDPLVEYQREGFAHVPDDDGRDPRGDHRVPLQPRGRGEPGRGRSQQPAVRPRPHRGHVPPRRCASPRRRTTAASRCATSAACSSARPRPRAQLAAAQQASFDDLLGEDGQPVDPSRRGPSRPGPQGPTRPAAGAPRGAFGQQQGAGAGAAEPRAAPRRRPRPVAPTPTPPDRAVAR